MTNKLTWQEASILEAKETPLLTMEQASSSLGEAMSRQDPLAWTNLKFTTSLDWEVNRLREPQVVIVETTGKYSSQIFQQQSLR